MSNLLPKPRNGSLLLSDEIFRLMVESAKDYAIFTTDHEGRVTTWNAGAERVLGFKEEEIVGQDVRVVFTPEDNAHGRADFEMKEAMRTGRAEDRRWHMHKDGHRFWADGLMFPLKDDSRNVIGFLKIIRDRTAEKHSDDARDRAEVDLRLMLESATDVAIFTLTPDNVVASWNSGSERLFGYTEAEIVGQPGAILFVPEDRAAGVHDRALKTAADNGRAEDERWHARKDGGRFFVSGVTTPIRDAAGTLVGFTKVCRDITERTQSEEALRESETRLKFLDALSESTRAMVEPAAIMAKTTELLARHLKVTRCAYAVVDQDGDRFTIVHDWTDGVASSAGTYSLSMFGTRAAAEMRGGRSLVIHDVDRELRPEDGADTFNAIGIKAIVCCPLVRDGRLAAMMAVHNASPRTWTPKEVALVEETVERSWAHIERARAEEQFRLMADSIPQIVWIADADGEMEFFNRQFEAYTGTRFEPCSAQEIATAFLHPEDGPKAMQAFDEARRAGATFQTEHRIRSAAGEYRWFLVRAEPHRDPATGKVLRWFGTSTDVHDAKLAEAALRSAEERYRTLFTSMDEGYCVIEMLFDAGGHPSDYRFLEVNPAFERHSGMNSPVGKRMRELAPAHEPHWFETYGQVALTGEPVRFENEAKVLEGRWFDVYAFRLGEPEERRVAVLFTDISERKELERSLRHRAGELADADRRKNEFLAMLAHELRNPLSGITSAIRLAQRGGLEKEIPFAHAVIERQAKNLARLIDDLLDVSRITQGKVELKREVVDASAIIARAAEAVRPLIEQRRHELTVQVTGGSMHVDADPTRLEQIVGNLLTNAAKYSKEGGHITVSARRKGDFVSIAVRDTGIGISPEMLPKVFELFTQVDDSLARSEGGLGIGLTLVRQLVEMHGGTISAASEVGKGSEFTVRLPLAAKLPDHQRSETHDISGQGKRVLIVDDNADTARLTGRMLESMGFEVRVVHDGCAALDAARDHCPEVVLLDIGLPGMNGFEVARQLRQEHPCRHSLIIGVSGYGDAEAREQAREAGFDHHLVKPVDYEKLVAIMRQEH